MTTPHSPGPDESRPRTEAECAQLAEWAENVDPTNFTGGTVLSGAAAAEFGRRILEEASDENQRRNG